MERRRIKQNDHIGSGKNVEVWVYLGKGTVLGEMITKAVPYLGKGTVLGEMITKALVNMWYLGI